MYNSIWHSIKNVGTFANKRDGLALQQNSAASPERTPHQSGSGGAEQTTISRAKYVGTFLPLAKVPAAEGTPANKLERGA